MQDNPRKGSNIPHADRRGTSVLALIGIGAVFLILAFLMLIRGGHQDADPVSMKTHVERSPQSK
jgi:hypothetical protein